MQDMKLTDVKMQDMKLQDMKLEDKQRKSSNRDYIIMEFLLFSKHATMVHWEWMTIYLFKKTSMQCSSSSSQMLHVPKNIYQNVKQSHSRPTLCTRLIMDCAKWNQQPVTVTSPKTRRNAETDASSKSAMADEGENCGTSSCIFWNTVTYKASVLRDIKAKKIGKGESAYGTKTVSSW